MGLFGNKKQNVVPVYDEKAAKEGRVVEEEVAQTSKEGKSRLLRVTVFPAEGGRPYLADVEPEEDGTFSIGDNMTFKIQRGSVWDEGGLVRALVNESNPLTINAQTLVGDDAMDPQVLHGIALNNLWVQLSEVNRRKSVWKQASTWGMMILGVIIILVLMWQINTLGNGLEGVEQALRGIDVAQGSAPATPAEQAGHQPIAPGG